LVAAVSVAKRGGLVLAALAILGLGWALAPRSAPPLYDGVGFPDEPYRFVQKPAGACDTKSPTSAAVTTTVTDGRGGSISLSTAEQAAQISVLIPSDLLSAPSSSRQLTIRATPVRPVPPPQGGYLWSNVYDVAATTPGVALHDTDPNRPTTITLRAATAQRPTPTIERYVNGQWSTVSTQSVGRDIYNGSLPALGRYAVIGRSPLNVSDLQCGTSSTSSKGVVIASVAGGVVVLLAGFGVWRRRRVRTAAAQDGALRSDGGEDDAPDREGDT
jgi:MYXO-CTERM domain-containing protein